MKPISKLKKEFRTTLKEIPYQSIKKSIREQSEDYILKTIKSIIDQSTPPDEVYFQMMAQQIVL